MQVKTEKERVLPFQVPYHNIGRLQFQGISMSHSPLGMKDTEAHQPDPFLLGFPVGKTLVIGLAADFFHGI